jgi:hypothetical protein
MKTIKPLVFTLLALFASSSFAQLEAFKDFDIGKKVYSMTTVKVKPNMMGDYLEGLRDTWVASNEVGKDLGQLEDYAIYQSQVGASGDFNLVLVITYKNAADLEPNEAAYKAFMKAWGEKMQEKSREISKNYPAMREITGEYRLREITMK